MTQDLTPKIDGAMGRSKTLASRESIALLHNPKYRELIRFFMAQPSTVQGASAATNQSVQRTYNYVQRLLETEFLEVISQQPRGGRAIKHYRATAEDYFVPFALTQALGYADMLEQELRPLQNQMLHAFEYHLAHHDPLEWGTRLFLDPSGFTHLSFTPKDNWQDFSYLTDLLSPDAPAMVNFLGKVSLSAAQAKTLQLELMQLWSKYYFAAHVATNSAHLETFGFGLSLVPLEE